MDKYEYKVRADEIKDLIAQGEYVQAAEIADTIDWRRVKSVMMLCTISDLYKINRRYEDARNMLLLAYERRPGGRTICYSLCELSIKMEDFVPAVNYYKEFVQVAPKDPGRYILQYKLYEAQDVSLEERIGVLEELKKRDYREKWAYELAYLYHRVGLATRCVEECDELILWFGEGKYVIKAMELKMLHQPLSPSQQEMYDHRFEGNGQAYYGAQQEAVSRKQPYYGNGQETVSQEQPYYGNGQGTASQEPPYYETGQEPASQEQLYYETQQDSVSQGQNTGSGYELGGKTKIYESVSQEQLVGRSASAEQRFSAEPPREVTPEPSEELDIQVKPMDLGQYNTINLQAEIAAGLREVLEEDQKTEKEDAITRTIMAPMMESETESLDLPEIDEVDEDDLEPEAEVMEDSEVFFGETGEIGDLQAGGQILSGKGTVREIVPEIGSGRKIEPEEVPFHHAVKETALKKETVEVTVFVEDEAGEAVGEPAEAEAVRKPSGTGTAKERQKTDLSKEQSAADTTAQTVMEQLKRESRAEEQALTAQPPKAIANVLSQESDGQISLVMPESEQIEKQITGQMNLEDILREWERMKQENAERRKEEVRQHVLQQTGEMFTAFEAAVRDGLLEQLESDNTKAQESTPETFTEKANVDDGETAEDSFYEETEEEYPEENEDWDRRPQDEPEDILREAEQEIIFGDADEVEETGDAEDAYGSAEPVPDVYEAAEEAYEPEEYEAYEAEEPAAEVYEEEETAEPDLEVEEYEADAYETDEAESASETEGADEIAEPAQEAYNEEEAVEPGSGAAEEDGAYESGADAAEETGEPETEKADKADGEDASEPETTVGQKSQTTKAEKPAKQKLWANKAEESAKKKPEAGRESPGEGGEQPSIEREKGKVRGLTKEEKELYGPYIQSRASREQLVQAIDNISMAAYTGNIVITGEEGMDTVSLAKNMIREVQMTDSNFAGKVAKISGQALNKKDVETTINQLASGALIIQKASGMDADTAKRLHKALQQESFGIIIILEDVKKAMNKFLEQYPKLAACFTARMDVESLSNGTLVAFGRKYAREREYSIDDMGILALHTRIDEMQTSDHVVTVLEVKELVDNAIRHANKKTLKHFFDILFARRYDEEDMIVLSERDFV